MSPLNLSAAAQDRFRLREQIEQRYIKRINAAVAVIRPVVTRTLRHLTRLSGRCRTRIASLNSTSFAEPLLHKESDLRSTLELGR